MTDPAEDADPAESPVTARYLGSDGEVEARFTDQVRIEGRGDAPVGLGGDSGSLVVTAESTPRAVGLYFAGPEDGTYGVANPIDEVLERLDVEILP